MKKEVKKNIILVIAVIAILLLIYLLILNIDSVFPTTKLDKTIDEYKAVEEQAREKTLEPDIIEEEVQNGISNG